MLKRTLQYTTTSALLLSSLVSAYRVPFPPGSTSNQQAVASTMRDVRGLVCPRGPEEERDQPSVDPHDSIASFQPRVFEAPWGLGANCHFQTIWGARAVQEALTNLVGTQKLPATRRWEGIYDRRERWTTPDDDVISVDFLLHPDSGRVGPSRPMVVTLHGLESCSTAILPRSMAKAFYKRGFDVAAVNFRSCCGHDNLKPHAYHLGFTDDLHFVLRRLNGMDPTRRLYLSGFSLGGNVILKCLGELGDDATDLGVMGAAVACVPFDAVRSSGKIDSGFNRKVYAANFLSTLKVKAEKMWQEGLYDIEKVRAVDSIGAFDDEVIAKLYGFDGNIDYYRKSCSRQYLAHIKAPVLVINAIDDPFIDEAGLPGPEHVGQAPVRLLYHENGGHCGFVSGKEPEKEEDRWLPTELARFLLHAEEQHRKLHAGAAV